MISYIQMYFIYDILHLYNLTPAQNMWLNIFTMSHTYYDEAFKLCFSSHLDFGVNVIKDKIEDETPMGTQWRLQFIFFFLFLVHISGVTSRIWEVQMIFHVSAIRVNTGYWKRKINFDFSIRGPQGKLRVLPNWIPYIRIFLYCPINYVINLFDSDFTPKDLVSILFLLCFLKYYGILKIHLYIKTSLSPSLLEIFQ